MALWKKNLILSIIVIVLAVLPLITLKNAEFAGADGLAETAITEINPDYEPWFSSLYEPASGEIESLLFAVQAALGAGVAGFILGRITAKKGE
ncbi:energy-coupling factor ABC transporter substrate-binding protein [Mucispirillum schaedleri]|jgi:cobalt/nickel transport protein|uniref:Cobalt transport protein CbiN n=1 Tax=Mucispirillum schaedleri ASF457 TaxID=1379858 RepID=V2Q1U0_9BACT|nr:energy-coupling factor ABC transporter substrate-binding protein [Mucispirillum schaedleri]MCX4359656.1 energy-coupling factor ABC transporter substrate-binding protein [Mucispirillum schaedleri]USF24047.1 Cobalt transport protein CbiN [Mucispirillum schaedleri ASF457]SIW06311.1 Cobalt transport protein CbiN [Mucispirillum schaedleri ASF457]